MVGAALIVRQLRASAVFRGARRVERAWRDPPALGGSGRSHQQDPGGSADRYQPAGAAVAADGSAPEDDRESGTER